MPTTKRFDTLDSWRGICAIIVALGHFCFYLQHIPVTMGPLVKNSFIFVDYFFVLSGFVISLNYKDKITSRPDVCRFIALRFGRIYPLHVFVLILLIGLEFIRSKLQHDAMFIDPTKSISTLFSNLLLLHSMGLHSYLSWNFPSWSISVEFYTYVLFALVVLFFGIRRLSLVSIILYIGAPVALFLLTQRDSADFTYDFGIIRCVGGFFGGVLVQKLYQRTSENFSNMSLSHATIIEILLLVAVYLFASIADTPISYLSSFFFAFCVYVFALEKGQVSNFLKKKPFLFLGMLSYSLYMTHAVVQRVMVNVIDMLEGHVGLDIVKKTVTETDTVPYFDVNHSVAFLLTLVMLCGTVVFSTLTYYFIEKPSYRWAKDKLSSKNEAHS